MSPYETGLRLFLIAPKMILSLVNSFNSFSLILLHKTVTLLVVGTAPEKVESILLTAHPVEPSKKNLIRRRNNPLDCSHTIPPLAGCIFRVGARRRRSRSNQ